MNIYNLMLQIWSIGIMFTLGFVKIEDYEDHWLITMFSILVFWPRYCGETLRSILDSKSAPSAPSN